MSKHQESHRIKRVGLLRAAVLGANDGLISSGSLVIGIAAASMTRHDIIITCIAGIFAGAMSMAAGEYVSVSSQSDTEAADLKREEKELLEDPVSELKELAGIYEKRGLENGLALEVAKQLTAKNALEAHARDELGISDFSKARPIQAAFISAITFSVGAILPLLIVILFPVNLLVIAVSVSTLLFLAILGAIGAMIGGASIPKAMIRVVFWGAFAMSITAIIGKLFGNIYQG